MKKTCGCPGDGNSRLLVISCYQCVPGVDATMNMPAITPQRQKVSSSPFCVGRETLSICTLDRHLPEGSPKTVFWTYGLYSAYS